MPKHWLKNLSQKAAHVRLLQPMYEASLSPLKGNLHFNHFPSDLFPGDAGRGRWMTMGHIDIGGYRVPYDQDQWHGQSDLRDSPLFTKLHGFGFLGDLKALGGDAGRRCARDMVARWTSQFGRYNTATWTIPLSAKRFYNLLVSYPFAFDTASDEVVDDIHACLYKHYQHLHNGLSFPDTITVLDRFYALWACLIGQCHSDSFYDSVDYQSLLQILKSTLSDVIDDDGGLHKNRNICTLIDVAQSCIILRQSMQMAAQTPPLWLVKQIENMVRTLNILTHSDKDISQFQGGITGQSMDITRMNRLSDFRFRRNDTQFKHFGYTSMRKGRTSVIIDHGQEGEYQSPLAFEMAHSGHRVIIGCGAYYADQSWREGLKGIAAHSAVTVGNRDPKYNAQTAKTSLELLNGASLFSGTHYGYDAVSGIIHTRRIYLDSKGEDIRGEDILMRKMAIDPIDITLRFHLHPTIKASVTDDHLAVLLRLPSGGGWVVQSNFGPVGLEESIHCPDGFHIRKTSQIVIPCQMDDVSLTVKWAIKRI